MEFKPLIMPRSLYCEKDTLTDTYGKFYAEPFERGYGTTIGNSLRRILLSSIQGAAVTSVRIEGIKHEFSYIEGIKEDVSEIVLNLKSLNIRFEGSKGFSTVYLNVKGPKEVKASDIELNSYIQILNPNQHIATLNHNAHLKMEINVELGRAYVPALEFVEPEDENETIGLIPVDASFSPVKKVRYYVEDARVGQRTDYDKLIIEVTTNGTVTPEEAIKYAARILRDHLSLFVKIEEDVSLVQEPVPEEEEQTETSVLEEKLDKSIEELELSVRSFNCLEAAGIKTIRDLVQKSEGEMLKYRNFGRKSLTEIKNILKDMGLSFNMKIGENGLPIDYIPSEHEAEESLEEAAEESD